MTHPPTPTERHHPLTRKTHRRLGKIVLEALSGEDQGRSFVLEQSPAIGGRSPLHPIALTDASVSAVHFELSFDDRGVFLRDLGSKNGTKLSDARLFEARAELEQTTVFQAGAVRFRVSAAEAVDFELLETDHFGPLWGSSPSMRELFARLQQLAPTPVRILLQGETGTGKEGAAQALHEFSGRTGEFVVLDCAAQPPALFESVLFGHRRGSFSGAIEDRTGVFEQASGGTLLIDEIGVLPPELQTKLLRVLQDNTIQRIGENKRRPVDVRIVAATNVDLPELAQSGEFRLDLLQRIAQVRLVLPPLRERGQDVLLLTERFLDTHARLTGIRPKLEPQARDFLTAKAQRWPGNVRQLRNMVEAAAHVCTQGVITKQDLVLGHLGPELAPETISSIRRASASPMDEFALPQDEMLREVSRRYLEHLVRLHDGDIEAIRAHGGYANRSSLFRAFDRFGVARPIPKGS